MHPDIGGPNRLEIFGTYFFRKPDLKELTLWRDRVLYGRIKGRLVLDNRGVSLGWKEKDDRIEATGKAIFNFTVNKYEPAIYGQKEMNEAFATIEDLIGLSKAHHFNLIFFITPLFAEQYLNQAESLWIAKERLAKLTDYYDFGGINSITSNAINYYDEESHYRHRVGDLMIARIFGVHSLKLPDDFGVLVTKKNIQEHIKKQQQELKKYLADRGAKH